MWHILKIAITLGVTLINRIDLLTEVTLHQDWVTGMTLSQIFVNHYWNHDTDWQQLIIMTQLKPQDEITKSNFFHHPFCIITSFCLNSRDPKTLWHDHNIEHTVLIIYMTLYECRYIIILYRVREVCVCVCVCMCVCVGVCVCVRERERVHECVCTLDVDVYEINTDALACTHPLQGWKLWFNQIRKIPAQLLNLPTCRH